MEDLISIVVPIYNVEKYLTECVNSLINQSYKNIEIILVDDGSTDNCPQICEYLAAKDGRIRVVHKQNAGLGMARNTGIEHATGKYIFFIDSDDFIDIDTVLLCYEKAEEDKSDIVVYGYNRVTTNGGLESTTIPVPKLEKYVGSDVLNKFLPDYIAKDPQDGYDPKLWMSACGCMFLTKIIKDSGWRFVSERDIISEDTYSLLQLYKYVNCVSIISKAFYNYRLNLYSLTHIYRADRFEKIKHFYQMSIAKATELQYPLEVNERIKNLFLSFTIGALKGIVHSDLNRKDKKTEFKKVFYDDMLQTAISTSNIKYEPITRKILFLLIKYKLCNLAFLVVKLKNN